MATEKYRFFDSVGDDRIYQADQFAEYFRMFLGDGIRNGGSCLQVTATGDGLQLKVDYGMAMIQGYAYWLEKDGKGPFLIDLPEADRLDRIDRLVLRLDRSMAQRHVQIFFKQGTANGGQSEPPLLTRTENIWELSLAKIKVRGSSLQLKKEDVTDERFDAATCGIINSLITLDGSEFDRQAQEVIERLSNQGYLPLTGTAKNSERLDGRLPSAYATAEQGRKADQALPLGGGLMTGNIDMKNNRILNVPEPYGASHVVNKGYVDRKLQVAEQAFQTLDIYQKIADGAGAHNSIFRGKNLGSSVTSTQWANIKNGTFKDLFIGDYWQIDGVNWRIGAFDYYLRKGTLNTAHHHVVIVPDSILKGGANKQMNSQGTTAGGFMGSAMITTHIGQVRAQQPYTIFGYDHMMGFNVFLTNAVSNGRPSAGIWVTMNISLLSELLVFGSHVFGASNSNGNPPLNHTVEHTQLPLFSLATQYITETNGGQYWLQDIVSSASFATVEGSGRASYALANTGNIGVRPYFCIYQQ